MVSRCLTSVACFYRKGNMKESLCKPGRPLINCKDIVFFYLEFHESHKHLIQSVVLTHRSPSICRLSHFLKLSYLKLICTQGMDGCHSPTPSLQQTFTKKGTVLTFSPRVFMIENQHYFKKNTPKVIYGLG